MFCFADNNIKSYLTGNDDFIAVKFEKLRLLFNSYHDKMFSERSRQILFSYLILILKIVPFAFLIFPSWAMWYINEK